MSIVIYSLNIRYITLKPDKPKEDIMPLPELTRDLIHNYCIKDLPGDINWHIDKFQFIDDNDELKNKLGRAFYAARYISKLMEALFVSGDEIHPFVKFQTIQYASIYEAVISYMLWGRLDAHEEVKQLSLHKAYKPVNALGSLAEFKYGNEEIFTCVYRDAKTPKNSIPFDDKVDCGVRIGFIDERYAEDIKKVYKLRNLTHIETEAKKLIEIEIEHSKLGYWRMQPFLEKVSEYTNSTMKF